MSNPFPSRSFSAILTLAAAAAALGAQTPTGFPERYALADDRAAVVAELIPGTEDWYYFHCRERLDARDFDAVRKVLPTWIKRHGRTDRVIEIENREALLSFGDNQERTYDFLRQRLGLRFQHERVVPGARSDLATRLDPNLISPATLTATALARHPGTVDGFEDRALASLLARDLDDRQLHSLLRRLRRPDVPNLPALIVRDLGRRESRGFGSLPIHDLLRRDQLDACLSQRPALLQEPRFVAAYLTRLQPDADTAWYDDPDARLAHLQRLWAFAQRLTPQFNSFKAHVLYHWLRHDLSQGAPDKERFLAYIRLPRRHGHPARAHLERFPEQRLHVDPGSQYPTLLPAIGNDEGLVRRCLEHYFQREDSIDAYSDFLDASWLGRVLAETKILAGEGDMERWYSLLNDPRYLEQLEKRVELRFAPTQQQHYAADEAVSLTLDVKNVPTLLVKVFAVDSYRYHVERQKPVDATIELDGVVANHERTYDYAEPPVRRVRRTFDLPMLREPGTYVVEFVGNGISSRAVVHKGGLRMVERTTAAGQAVRVYDETGRHVPQAIAWFGGREYTADDRGEILLPFTTDPGEKKLVLRHDRRSSIATFTHRAESYDLRHNAHVDREALIAGNTARLVLRPQMTLAGHAVSPKLLQDPLLTIVATDLDGLTTTQEVRDLELVDGAEFVHELRVPSRLLALSVSLSASVEGLDGKPVQLSGGAEQFAFNGIDASAETAVPMLLRTTGGYAVELRGKNGEVRRGRVCHVTLVHRDYREPVNVPLQTDERGRVQLGRLDGIARVQVVEDGGTGGTFDLVEDAMRAPAVLHGAVGQTLRVPYLGERTSPSRDELSLLGQNEDAFDHLAIANGFVELRDLAPGDYSLQLHTTGQEVTVRVTDGEADGAYLLGDDRVLSASTTRPLHVTEVATTDEGLRVRVRNASSSARVHLITTRYLPTYDVFAGLRGNPAEPATVQDLERLDSSYHAGRKLGDEYRYVLERRFAPKYPGNMLERPSLLLNPIALERDSWNEAVGLGGGAGGKFGGRARGRRGGRAQQQGGDGHGSTQNAGVSANLDYLPAGSVTLTNLRPDEDGYVTVPADALGAGQHVHVLALDGPQAVYRTTVRVEQPLEPRARTLPRSLASERHFVEKRQIRFVAAGESVTLDSNRTAEADIHDSLASVYRLFATISKDEELQRFAFLLEWPTLTRERKLELYDEHACHELHFFLHQKDNEFFRSVVRPYLANKLEKTFLDRWLLEDDLQDYLEPWRFARLNVVERILLARRVGDGEPGAVARALREALELAPKDPGKLDRLFRLALLSEQLGQSRDKVELMERSRSRRGLAPEPSMSPAAPKPRGGLERGAGGPTTGGPAGPATAGRPARNEAEKQSKKLKDEADAAPAEEAKVAEAEEFFDRDGGLDRRASELQRRKNTRTLYRAVEKTRLFVEHDYHDRTEMATTADVVPVNRFWVDYASSPAGEPFVSAGLVEATGSFLEMVMALSVLDLPFEAGEHTTTVDGDVTTLTAATPLLLVQKEISPSEKAADSAPLLVGQNFFRLDDRYQFVDGQRRDRFVGDEFLAGVAYGCQVVVTNPTSAPRTTELLLQIPAGAVPLQRGFWTRGRTIELGAYATATVEYSFYFPTAGEYSHYPVHAAEEGELTAFADSRRMKVVDRPSKVDTSSWAHVSQEGTPAEVLAFLDTHNVQRLDLDKIAWRLRDRTFFTAVIDRLEQRHVYDATLWSYGVLHRDADATREYLRHRDDFLNRCGEWLDAPLVQIDPRERLRFRHLELSPLVHQRAHQLGSERKFGNKDLEGQYAALMNVLGYRPDLDGDDWLAVTYYFLLQDRVGDALEAYARIDASQLEAKLQYDYLSAYLCFFTSDVARARTIAERHRDHPVAHWQKRFRTVLGYLDEAEGKAAPTEAEQTPDTLAATAPALELAVEGKTVSIAYENLGECEVRYYELDVEFAFSAQPFAGPDGASAAFVQPNDRETRSLPAAQEQVTFQLPQQFWQKNVLVEVRAGGLVRSRQYFANALDVRFLESYGQVAVSEPGGEKPLAKTYVKVFAKLQNGQVRFHKDGYTDLRGRFDYASLSDDPNRSAVRYAVMVLDEARGAVIREIAPPAR